MFRYQRRLILSYSTLIRHRIASPFKLAINSPISITPNLLLRRRHLFTSATIYNNNTQNVNNNNNKDDELFKLIKLIYKHTDPKTDPASRANQFLELYNDQSPPLRGLLDPRYQSMMKHIRSDDEIDNDLVWELARIYELYVQNRQSGDDFRYTNIDYSRPGGRHLRDEDVKNGKHGTTTKTVFGKELNKRQIVITYFATMGSLLVLVTLYGVANMSMLQVAGLTGLVLWISFTFNPFF